MSSYEAFRLRELKQKIPYVIESITTAGNLVFIGTNDGKLIVYELSPSKGDLRCLHIHTARRKHPVLATIPIVEKQILVAVADDAILVFRLEEPITSAATDHPREDQLQELSAITGMKDITAVHVKRQKGIFSMAVLQRKKVSIYEYREQGQRQEFIPVRDGLQVPDGGKSLTWASRNIMVALRREYLLVDVASGMVECLYPTSNSKGVNPLLLPLDPVPEVLVDNGRGNGARALHDGTILAGNEANTLVWSSPPNGATYVHPFLLTVHSSSGLEVRLPFASTTRGCSETTPLGQSIGCKGIERISHRSYADFDVTLPTKSTPADAFRRDVTIATSSSGGSTNTVYLVEMVPPREQVMGLISAKQFEFGLLLYELCVNEVEEALAKSMQTHYALWCVYKRGDVKTAILRFRDARVDPRLVISLFPGFLTQRARDAWQVPADLSELLSSFRAFEGVVCSNESVDLLLDYVTSLRPEYIAAGSSASVGMDTSLYPDVDVVLEAVDTAILRAYVFLGQEKELLNFLCTENACAPRDSEQCLLEGEQWVGLVALWHRQGLHSRSLELLKELAVTGEPTCSAIGSSVNKEGEGIDTVPNTIQDDNVIRDSFNDEFLSVMRRLLPKVMIPEHETSGIFISQSDIYSHVEAPMDQEEDLQQSARLLRRCVGVVTTILYCRKLAWDIPETLQLVARHALWVLANIPPLWSVMLFPVDKMTAEQQAAVLRLVRTDMMGVGTTNMHERVVEWLSLILGNQYDTCRDAAMHDAYWKSLVEVVFVEGEQAKSVGVGAEIEVEETEIRQRRRKVLCDFLSSSSFMNLSVVRAYLEQPTVRSQAYPERAIIYQRLKLHGEAVRMCLYEMNQLEEAKYYAIRASRDEEDVFLVLLKELLRPSTGAEPRLEEAMSIASTCGSIEPLAVLELLPDNTPIAVVEDFLRRSLSVAAMRNRSAAIYASVLEARVRQAEKVLELEKSRRVVIDIESSCAVCGKKLRPGTVFARFPNGILVHHVCIDDESVCPVTHKDFRKGVEVLLREVL